MLITKGKQVFSKKLIAMVVLAFAIGLLMLLSGHPHFIERYYSEGLYPVICRILHPVFGILPFSLGDIVYMAVITWLVYALFMIIKHAFKKDFKRVFSFVIRGVIGFETGFLLFYLFWGMNYFRPSAGELLNLRDSSYTTADLKAVAHILIDSANATRARVSPVDLKQDNSSIYETAVAAVKKLSADSVKFYAYAPAIKPSLLTPLLNYIGTSGYFNPFTGEGQINYQMPVFNRPVVACHEMSHQMGFGAEDEADFVGFLAGIGSKDRLLRYSAYHLAMGEFMRTLYFRDSSANRELKLMVSPAVHHDYVVERAYWLRYQSRIDDLTGIFYDKFLKVNNQPHGLATYNRMVLLVMAEYKKSSLVQ
jgi:hypothetical protein